MLQTTHGSRDIFHPRELAAIGNGLPRGRGKLRGGKAKKAANGEAEVMVNEGFDPRVPRRGMYGVGVYLTSES